MKLTRDLVRKAFADAGLTNDFITQQNLSDLITHINQEMINSGLINDTYRMRRVRNLRMVFGKKVAELRCQSRYFENREAVTFNQNGFIGIGGWADDQHLTPIINGFLKWVKTIHTAGRAALKGGAE